MTINELIKTLKLMTLAGGVSNDADVYADLPKDWDDSLTVVKAFSSHDGKRVYLVMSHETKQ